MDRQEGFCKVLNQRGVDFDQELIVECDGDQFSAYRAFKAFLERQKTFSAVFAHNDPMRNRCILCVI